MFDMASGAATPVAVATPTPTPTPSVGAASQRTLYRDGALAEFPDCVAARSLILLHR